MKAGSNEHLHWLLNEAPRDNVYQFENWVGCYVMSDWDTPITCSLKEAGLDKLDNKGWKLGDHR